MYFIILNSCIVFHTNLLYWIFVCILKYSNEAILNILEVKYTSTPYFLEFVF